MKFFEFTKNDYDFIVEQCMLDEEYQKLLKYRINGYSIVKIADLLHCSESRIYTMLKKLKRKIKKIL